MKVAILDDYQNVFMILGNFKKFLETLFICFINNNILFFEL